MNYTFWPIGDNDAIPDEIKLAARKFCLRRDDKELVCKVGPGETQHLLPRRILLDEGITIEVLREAVVDGKLWLAPKGDLAI